MAEYISQITLPNNTTYDLKDAAALPKSGGILTGGLEIKGHIAGDGSTTTGHGLYGGGMYHNAYNNIILHGDASTGSSGIAFISDKVAADGTITNRNAPSDRAFIQYHACGVTTATTEGTNPTLASGNEEAGRLVIGIGNDAGDKIILQAPGTTDIVHQMGANSYPIPHTTNTNGSVGGTTTPVYVDAGVIKALSYTIAKSVPSDAVFTDHYAWNDITGKPSTFSPSAHDHNRLSGIGRKTTIDTIAYNPSVDNGCRLSWLIYDSSSRNNDAINTPSFDATVLNLPWDWGGFNGQIAISSTASNNTRLQIRSSSSVDNGENANPRYTTNYGAWREVVTATKATKIGDTNKPVYISATGEATAISYTIEKSVPSNAVFTDHYAWGDITGKPTKITLTGAVTGNVSLGSGDLSLSTTVNHNHDDRYKITSGVITLGSSMITPVTSVNGHTGASVTVTAEDLNLSKAMHFIGVATVAITDGSTTDPVISGYSTKTAGDVIIDKDSSREYVWSTTNKWELLGGDSSYKTVQTAVSSPTASGSTTSFIDTISQNENGVITVTKKNLDTSGTWSGTAAQANYLHPFTDGTNTSGTTDIQILTTLQADDNIPRSKPFGVLLQHGNHSVGFGYFYPKSSQYGGWYIANYGGPSYVAVTNGTWETYRILTSNNTASGTNNAATLTWGTTYTIAKINGTDIKFTTMAKPSYDFTDLTAHPTTLNGYGITDAKIASGVITLGSNTITPLTAHQTIIQDGLTGATINRYGECTIAADTAAKTVTIINGSVPTLDTNAKGLKITVKFTNANTADNPTLNVNSKGAKNIYHNGVQITSGVNKALLAGVCDFIFDGVQWHLVGNYYDTTYSNQAAVSGGTAVSLVTTGEKYTWNQKQNALNISSNGSTTKWLNEQGSFTTPTAANIGALSNTVITDTLSENQYPIIFNTNNSANQEIIITQSNTLQFQPSSGTLFATNFSGNISWSHITNTPTFISALTAGEGISLSVNENNANGYTIGLEKTGYNTLGGIKTWYLHNAASSGPTPGTDANAITVNAIQNTLGRYYAIESDSDGRLFVNVPWENTVNAVSDILQGSNSGTSITYAPYTTRQSSLSFDTANSNPSGTSRLNLNGYLYATKLYSNGTEVSVDGHTHSTYVAKTGDTMTGSLSISRSTTIANRSSNASAIFFKPNQTDNSLTYTGAYVAVYDDGDSANNGTNMIIRSGGNVIIGGGESSSAVYANAILNKTANANISVGANAAEFSETGENLILCSDSTIFFLTSCGTVANRNLSYLNASGYLYTTRTYNAVWNDYAECRIVETEKPGKCVTESSDGKMIETTERLMPGCKITSDTYGVCMGETSTAKTPIAVAGRVLVYPYRARSEYPLGAAVCSAPGGTVDIMTREEIREYPERIVGTVSEIPNYTIWHSGAQNGENDIEVNGRIWIYVK